jgi:FlaA1/EpsC-like NDP-sugar epimerase
MKQIADGGPINVTHKDITRYFMTIPEAVSLILQSTTYMKGSDIFVLDMGEPVKIYDLAENMIRLSGLTPHEDIEIKIVGLRPGEKLFEELLINAELNEKTENSKIFKEEKPFSEIKFTIEDIPNLDTATKEEIKTYLKSKVTSYQPSEN